MSSATSIPRNGPTVLEIRAAHDQISSAGETVLLDVQLEAVREHALIRFESGNRRIAFTPDLDITAQNCSFRRELKSTKSAAKPVGMRTAVSIYERKNVCARGLNAAIARQARSRSQFLQ